jgi:peptide/nickel transport system substrate-binding protein
MMALKFGIDRQKIVDNVYSGFASIGNDNCVGPKMKFYNPNQVMNRFDPDKAKFHFAKSKHVGAIELQVSEGAFSGATDAGQIFQESLSKAGINLDLKRVSGDGYWDNVWLKQPFCAVYWGNRPTIDNQLTSIFYGGKGNPWNDSHFENAEFSRTLEAARVEMPELDALVVIPRLTQDASGRIRDAGIGVMRRAVRMIAEELGDTTQAGRVADIVAGRSHEDIARGSGDALRLV